MSHFTAAFWTDRGIDPKMAAARPYIPWTIENIGPVTHAYKDLNQSQRAYMTRLARQSDGWVITRHTILGEPHVYAEIRPDKKVVTGPPVRHWHGSGEAPHRFIHRNSGTLPPPSKSGVGCPGGSRPRA